MKLSSTLAAVSLTSFGVVNALPSSLSSSLQNLFSSSNEQVVLELTPGEFMITDESEKNELKRRGYKFMDVTKYHSDNKEEEDGDTDDSGNPIIGLYNKLTHKKNNNNSKLNKDKDHGIEMPIYEYPSELSKKLDLPELFANINVSSLYDTVSQLSSFYNRYYKSAYGLESSNWLHDFVHEITAPLQQKKENGVEQLITIEKFDHDFVQNSIILRINSISDSNHTVVIGSHLDSINLLFPSVLPAPGCDDDASGTAAAVEVLKVYVQYLLQDLDNRWPTNNVEFHFYAAEEAGLLGSQDVFHDRRARQSGLTDSIVAMLQLDQVGYISEDVDEYIGVMTDYVSPGLTTFMKALIVEYLSIPYIEDVCGYACSDHASASKYGYPSAMVMECVLKDDNKFTHSSMDTIDRLNFDHIAEFVKLGLATILELGDYQGF